MSGKSKEKTTTKHYTPLEKETFIQLLLEYKDIIENEKSDGSTLKKKEDAWKSVVERFNSSLRCCTQRNVTQLKKFWSNLKQHQRDAKTKEAKGRMGTGGGPEPPSADIDPIIEMINPHLMQRAPCSFTSNLTQEDLERNVDLVNAGNEVMFVGPDNSLIIPMEAEEPDIESEVITSNEEGSSASPDLLIAVISETQSSSSVPCESVPDSRNSRRISEAHSSGSSASTLHKQNVSSSSPMSWQRKRNQPSQSLSSSDNSGCSVELNLKADRIRKITLIEEEIYRAKLAYELECTEKKRKHLEKLFEIEENTARAEERAAKAKADLAELELDRSKKKYQF